jgi:hypothetical protein
MPNIILSMNRGRLLAAPNSTRGKGVWCIKLIDIVLTNNSIRAGDLVNPFPIFAANLDSAFAP